MRNTLKVANVGVLLFAVFISMCNATFAQQPLDTNLIGYWTFDDQTARDVSGNNHHGIIYGSPTSLRTTNGSLGYYFDGQNDFIEIPFHEELNVEDFTLTFWFSRDKNSQPGVKSLINKSWSRRNEGTSADVITMIPSESDFIAYLNWNGLADYPPSEYFRADSFTMINDSLFFVAFVKDGRNVRLTINDRTVLSQTLPINTDLYRNARQGIWTFAAQYDNGNLKTFFQGILDNVRLYKVGLSEQKIIDIYRDENKNIPKAKVSLCSETDCESVVISLTEQETGGIQHLEIASPSNVVITENTFRPGSTQATIAAEAESPFADAVFTVRQYSSSYRALERVVVIPGFTISADSVITTFRPVNNYLCDSVYFYNPSNRFQQFTYAFSTADSVIFPPTFDENTVLLAPKTGVRVPVCYLLRPSGVATVNLTFQDACGRRKVKELKKYFVPSTVADKGEEQSSWVEIRGNVLRAKADCTIKLYDILGKEVLMRMLIAEQLEELPKGHYAIVIEKGLQVERFVIVIE